MATEISSPTTTADTAAISVKGVCHAYVRHDGSTVPVLNNLNLDVRYRQIVGLVGRNGAGKTTLLEILRGALVPQQGVVKVGRTLVSSSGRRVARPPVAIISQRPDAGLAPSMTVYENYAIATARRHCGIRWAYSKSAEHDCRILLSRADMGLDGRLSEQVRFLSAGQQQALSVLLALEASDHVLLMDEPTAALDPFSAKKILDLAITESERIEGTILLVSHRLHDITERCSRIILLQDGRVSDDFCCCEHPATERELLTAMAASAPPSG